MGAQLETGGTHQVADILDDQHVDLIQIELG